MKRAMRSLPLLREVELDLAAYEWRPEARCWVYEVWDTQNRLCYVGVADDFDRRWRQHYSKSWWMREIRVERVYVDGYETRSFARQVEAETIHDQSPVYNTMMERYWYQKSQEWLTDPERPTEFDCVPVKKRYFKGVL